jgi:mannose-6-phosphate isomerase-like protein (cupin superfamily)
MHTSTFPGGTSVTFLDVYADAAPDGHCGGTPHLHTVSTEAYIVIGGRGIAQTIDGEGFHETPLSEGVVVWFTPGTVHRAVNIEDLRIVVLMSNAGLPEAGDAVMTFPTEVLSDPSAYEAAATLPPKGDAAVHARAAERRDLAVEGFLRLRDALEAGDDSALPALYDAAVRIVGERSAGWREIIAARPVATAERSLAMAAAVLAGDAAHLVDSRTRVAERSGGDPGFGMCGRLRTYDVGEVAAAGSAPEHGRHD